MQLYNTIIRYLSIWAIISLVLLFCLMAFGFDLNGENRQLKIRLAEKDMIINSLYVHIDSVNSHYLDMERNGCFQKRVKNDNTGN